MKDRIPTSKLSRTLSCGGTATQAGTKLLKYYVKRPFLSKQERPSAKDKATAESARTLFQGLSLLRGTALKMAQQLSLELDLLPEGVRIELAKACNEVPPINRALVRKVVQNGLGGMPEDFFDQFDSQAFAAASIGQVHRAMHNDGFPLAVKLQYPGIATTIENDVQMLRRILQPVLKSDLLYPTLNEIAARLMEEVNYRQEADNTVFFRERLKRAGVQIPEVLPKFSSSTVLTTTLLEGTPLNEWLKGNPSQQERNRIAQQLNDLFITQLYDIHTIHADPNPGNFLIGENLELSLVDFGCIKKLNSDFVSLFRKLALAAAHNDAESHFQLLSSLQLIQKDLEPNVLPKIRELSTVMLQWYGKLYLEEIFDFEKHPQFLLEGQKMMRKYRHLQKHMKVNANFIFLDRTRYGLLRIFEKMKAKVCFRNKYEW